MLPERSAIPSPSNEDYICLIVLSWLLLSCGDSQENEPKGDNKPVKQNQSNVF